MQHHATHIAKKLKATATLLLLLLCVCGAVAREKNRAIALPFEDSVYNFRMLFEYDSWNRVQRIVYPDSEVVSYGYDLAGQLYSVSTFKNNVSSSLINSILYDEFGHRTQVNFGNGVTTNYNYDILQRLSTLQTYSNNANLQKIMYSFDYEDNITKVINTAGGANGLGGAYTNEYNYDDLYRLTSANGSYAGNNTTYSLEMSYTPAGRLCGKIQDYTATANTYAYSQNAKPHAVRRYYNGITNELSNLRWDNNGNLAQQTVYSVVNNATTYQGMRYLQWDENDRLNLVAGDGYLSYYAYGYDGNRAVKMTGNAAIDQTGTLLNSTNLENITIYPSEYLTVTQAEYTKYYYAGGNRIASKIGTGGFGKMTRLCTLDQSLSYNANVLFDNAIQQTVSPANQSQDVVPVETCNGYNINTELLTEPLPTLYITQTNLSFSQNNLLQQFRQNLAGGTEAVYYFHSDHLGSASWITSGTGGAVQHLLYLPFGELFANEQSTGYFERFTFTGKERDAETGYYYHGARFNSSDIGWISVDPKFDKYPSLTPYNYCAWNPIKLVDPDGEFYAHTHALIVFKAIMETGLSGILRFGLNNIMVMCWGTSVVSDLFLMNETKVHLDGFNSKGINDPKDLTSEYNNAISNYNISILNGDYSDAGVALHTIADFYSHSNYIELYAEYATYKNKSSDIEKIPTFSEAQQDEDLMSYIIPRLKTGCYPDIEDDLSNSHKGISKDSKRKITGKEPYMKSDKNMYDAAKATAQKEISNIIMENIQ